MELRSLIKETALKKYNLRCVNTDWICDNIKEFVKYDNDIEVTLFSIP